jgi:hypothetical protein
MLYNPWQVSATFSATDWQKPALCGPNSGDCVEVNLTHPDLVAVRDTKLPAGPVLVFDIGEWEQFVAAVRSGQFDHRG